MRKIFDIFFLCFCLFIYDISAGSWAYSTQLPADIYLNSRIELTNREVIKKQQYLFTRVDLKPTKTSSASLNKSKASLYAQRNFAMYLQGQVRWNDNFSSNEKRMVQALYWQVTSVSSVLRGLTHIHSFFQNGVRSYIYSVEAPKLKTRKVSQRDVIEKIQKAAIANDIPLDYLTYLELALLRPELFSPQIGVKRLAKSCGQNFIFFLLGMDLPDPKALTGISKITLPQLASLDKYQIAVLIDERPYDSTLALAFAHKLLETNHEQLAKLTIRNGCRLEKSGLTYDEIYKLVKKWKVEPSGSYRYPVNSFGHQQLFIEAVNSELNLNSLSEAVLNSLGDVPLKTSKIQQFIPTGNYSNLTKEEFQEVFQKLQANQKIAITRELLEATGDLLYARGYSLMAYCFWHQALYSEPENKLLGKKILDQTIGNDFVKNSKLLSP
ncbi:MAG: hypothetical protein PVH85_32630 [Desulfobacterales bacterium]